MSAGSSGSAQDTSGVSSNMMGTFLSRTSNAKGIICTGIYGTGKSELAKRFSEEASALCVSFSISDMKDSLVGNSEGNIKRNMDTIEAIGGDGVFWIATSNRINQLPPELRRRFPYGTYFFNFPTVEERDAIWKIYLPMFGLCTPDEAAVLDMRTVREREGLNDEDWTGAEIRSCCEMAHVLNCSLGEAAREIVPVKNTAKTEIERLQTDADGKYKDASLGGLYMKNRPKAVSATSKRKERDISL